MSFTKPMVTIDLAEYEDLKRNKALAGTELTLEEYELCTTELVMGALRNPELFNRPPKEGVVLKTVKGMFLAKITQQVDLLGTGGYLQFKFFKKE